LERRLTANMPARSRNRTASPAIFAINVTPFTIGAPSMFAPFAQAEHRDIDNRLHSPGRCLGNA
jgi:hypothetical protein